MARRRLNKKIAIIGLIILVVIVLGIIALILRAGGSPSGFIEDGEKSVAAQNYEAAEKSFLKAIPRAKQDPLKIEILFKLADVYLKQQNWKSVRDCWESVVQIEPTNIRARLERLRYNYILADSGVYGFWQRIDSEAAEFIDVVDKSFLPESLAKWETFDKPKKSLAERLDCYLYLLKGRAQFEMASRGLATIPAEACEQAIEDLEQAKELEPDNVNAIWYLARAILLQGENQAQRGDLEAREKSAQQAQELLAKCVDTAKDNADAHINLLNLKLMIADREGYEAVKLLEPEYLSLIKKFDSSPQAFERLADYYLLIGPQYIDKAVEAIARAVALDKEDVQYPITAAGLYYYKFSIQGRKEPQIFEKSMKLAQKALELPGGQDIGGPYAWENTKNRLNVYSFLANRYIEQIVQPFKGLSQSEMKKLSDSAKLAIEEIEQIAGSSENINVIKWKAMLEFAIGNREEGIRRMYNVYEQLRASERTVQMDAQLPYLLAKAFENTDEQGAVAMFLTTALQSGIARWSRPEAILDYAETFLKLGNWTVAVSNIELYEEYFGSNQRSYSLGVLAYIGAGQFDEAQEQLASEPDDDVDVIKLRIALEQARIRQIRTALGGRRIEKTARGLFEAAVGEQEQDEDILRAELASHEETLSNLVINLMTIEPSAVEDVYISTLCEDYIFLGKIEEAKNLVDIVLRHFPDNLNALFYKRLISEPDPNTITIERRNQIEEEVLNEIEDPIDKAVNFGFFYKRNRQWDKAAQHYKTIIGDYLDKTTIAEFREDDEKLLEKKGAVDNLFGIALQTNDWQLAERLKDIAKINNLDGCEGDFYNARLAAAKKQPDALELFDECLRQRPVFSYTYLLRSNVHAALGNDQAALEDARKAASWNPLDGAIAKNLASILYQRNQKLGKSVTAEMQDELEVAVGIAMKANPGDLDLYGFYSELIKDTESDTALAIRQYLLSISPTVDNAVSLGRMAMGMALDETDSARKEALISIASSAYEQALSINPNDQVAIYNYAQYLLAVGQAQKAEKLLKESKGQRLLWTHYYQLGQYEQAEKLLEQVYEEDKQDTSVLRGLLIVAEKTSNEQNAGKYSEELLSLEDSVQNRLLQIKVFLNTGLVDEAELKLQSFREKYPDEPKAQYIEAWLLMKRGRLKEALDMANRSLENDRSSALAWQLRGEIYLLMADFDRAIDDFDQSRLFADDPETSLLQARAYLAQGRVEFAVNELKGAIVHQQTSSRARRLLERVYFRSNRKDALGQLYQDTLEKFPDSIYWLIQAARFNLEEDDLETAGQLYSQAWQKSKELGEGNWIALNGYLEVLLRSNQLDKLFDEAKKYVNTEFAPIALLEMAEAEMKMGNKERAIKYARQAADETAENEALLYRTIIAMYKVVGKEQVEAYCNEKIKETPKSLAANLFMYNLDLINSRYDKALERIDKCIEIVADNDDIRFKYMDRKASTFYMAYEQSSDKKYLQKAVDEYQSLLNKMPKKSNVDVLNNLAYMLAENNERLEQALEYAKQAYEERKSNPEFLDTYAYVLYKNEKYSQAEEIMYEAVQQFQSRRMKVSWQVYERLGMIEEKLGANLQAIAAYQRALEAGADELSESVRERINSKIELLSQQ